MYEIMTIEAISLQEKLNLATFLLEYGYISKDNYNQIVMANCKYYTIYQYNNSEKRYLQPCFIIVNEPVKSESYINLLS